MRSVATLLNTKLFVSLPAVAASASGACHGAMGQYVGMQHRVMQALRVLRNDRRAVTALEYGLIASLVAIALIVGATKLGSSLNSTFTAVAGKI